MTQTVPPARRGRPPKVARAHGDTREELLRHGMEVLTAQGMSATGLDSVLRQVGVPKGSFYHYFDSKDAFGLEVLQRYAEYFAKRLDRFLLDAGHAPLERLALFVADAASGMARYRFERGCLVGNLGQEVSTLPEDFRVRLEAVLLDWQRRLSACLQEAVDAGDLAPGVDCDELSEFFWIGWEGAVLRARLVRSERPLELFLAGFLAAART